MKKKYTKAKVEIISMKTEAFICTSPKVTGDVEEITEGEGSDKSDDKDDRDGDAKAFDGNGVNDFSFDPIPPTKE